MLEKLMFLVRFSYNKKQQRKTENFKISTKLETHKRTTSFGGFISRSSKLLATHTDLSRYISHQQPTKYQTNFKIPPPARLRARNMLTRD